jgi:ActR/RegA family two-component response regulator
VHRKLSKISGPSKLTPDHMLNLNTAPSGTGHGPSHLPSSADADESETPDKPSIMIVEDDFFIATELEHELTKAGYKVVGTAISATEAIELARRTRPVFAVMDVRLANASDGVEAALELYRELNIRSVFATAHSDAKTRARAEAASPLGWLAKPYSSKSLIEFLKKIPSR